MSPVIGFRAMDRAPIAIERGGVPIGTLAGIFDLPNASRGKPPRNIARKVEECMVGPCGRLEKAPVGLNTSAKPRDEFGTNFIIGLADQRPDRGRDAVAVGAAPFHRRDGGLDDTLECAAPARVRCADDAGFGVGKENRAAVRGGYPDCKAWYLGNERVGLRPCVQVPRPL